MQPLIKVLGISNSRIKKNEIKSLLEILDCFVNEVTENEPGLLTFREVKLTKGVLPNLLKTIKIIK